MLLRTSSVSRLVKVCLDGPSGQRPRTVGLSLTAPEWPPDLPAVESFMPVTADQTPAASSDFLRVMRERGYVHQPDGIAAHGVDRLLKSVSIAA